LSTIQTRTPPWSRAVVLPYMSSRPRN